MNDQVSGEGPSLVGGETRMRTEKEAEAHLEMEKKVPEQLIPAPDSR